MNIKKCHFPFKNKVIETIIENIFYSEAFVYIYSITISRCRMNANETTILESSKEVDVSNYNKFNNEKTRYLIVGKESMT